MTTNSTGSNDLTFDTSILTDRSMPSDSIIDMNHNNWQKITCNRKLTYDDDDEQPLNEIESPFCSQSTSNDDSTGGNSQKTTDHEQQTESLSTDCQSSMNKRPSQTNYHRPRLLKLGNVCQSSRKSRQPVVILDQLTMKYKIRVIDHSSWQWQPKLQLDKLTDDELKGVDCSALQSNPSVQSRINLIKFDKDEELIRELSPDTAAEQFQKVDFHLY